MALGGNYKEMKYIAKYLPIEGSYEHPEDLFFFKVNGKWTDKPRYADDLLGPAIEGVKKAQLFMCTKEIQIGDIVEERDIYGGFEKYEIHTLNDIDYDNQYKVLGRITNKYVNEGDEWDILPYFFTAQ